ncbi:MAG: hypothetical protein ACRD2P_07690 [Terriglobia bacterium]
MIAAAVFFGLFTVGMIKAKTRRQVMALALAGSVAAMVVAPRPARAQGSLIGAIQGVLNVINGVVHTALSAVASARNTMNQFYQLTIWPQQVVNQARALVTQMIGQYRRPMYGIFHLNLRSATLPRTLALEQVIRNSQTNDFSALGTNYTNVYGPVPGNSSASPYDQNMTDMDDALAEDTLKTLKESDEADSLTLGVADQIESAATQAAPGSAPFLTATAVVGAIQSQAVMQKMMAADLRQEAAYLAHRTALEKQGATSATSLANALMNLLQ